MVLRMGLFQNILSSFRWASNFAVQPERRELTAEIIYETCKNMSGAKSLDDQLQRVQNFLETSTPDPSLVMGFFHEAAEKYSSESNAQKTLLRVSLVLLASKVVDRLSDEQRWKTFKLLTQLAKDEPPGFGTAVFDRVKTMYQRSLNGVNPRDLSAANDRSYNP